MARILIVGCGCRGRELGRELGEHGHAVRGTSRSDEGRAAIEASGIEGVVADPTRLATLLPHLQGVSVLCWLVGGDRFPTLLETLVDTHVRGVVYDAVAEEEAARRAADVYRMPVERISVSPSDWPVWLADAVRAVESVLAA